MAQPEWFTQADVIARAKMTRSVFLDLLRAGVVTPSVRASTGRGVPQLFSADDIVRARLGAYLRAWGIPTKTVKALVQDLDTLRRAGLEVAMLSLDRKKGWVIRTGTAAQGLQQFRLAGVVGLWIQLDRLEHDVTRPGK